MIEKRVTGNRSRFGLSFHLAREYSSQAKLDSSLLKRQKGSRLMEEGHAQCRQ